MYHCRKYNQGHKKKKTKSVAYATMNPEEKHMNIFTNISDHDIKKMMTCFESHVKDYAPGETIHACSQELKHVGLILDGRAHLYCIDYDGNLQIIDYYGKDDVFGELFTLPAGSLEYFIEADSFCSVCFIPYDHITRPCQNVCKHHMELTKNLFFLTAKKSQELSLRISFISRKTVRQKLLTYFEYMADETESSSFQTHMSLAKLAEYLCVDRTSLMREIRYMNEEGIIASKGRSISIL